MQLPDLRPCFVSNDTMASYETHCADGALASEAEAGAEGQEGAGGEEAGGQQQGGATGEEL